LWDVLSTLLIAFVTIGAIAEAADYSRAFPGWLRMPVALATIAALLVYIRARHQPWVKRQPVRPVQVWCLGAAILLFVLAPLVIRSAEEPKAAVSKEDVAGSQTEDEKPDSAKKEAAQNPVKSEIPLAEQIIGTFVYSGNPRRTITFKEDSTFVYTREGQPAKEGTYFVSSDGTIQLPGAEPNIFGGDQYVRVKSATEIVFDLKPFHKSAE
jgi:hypothetical protein